MIGRMAGVDIADGMRLLAHESLGETPLGSSAERPRVLARSTRVESPEPLVSEEYDGESVSVLPGQAWCHFANKTADML